MSEPKHLICLVAFGTTFSAPNCQLKLLYVYMTYIYICMTITSLLRKGTYKRMFLLDKRDITNVYITHVYEKFQ